MPRTSHSHDPCGLSRTPVAPVLSLSLCVSHACAGFGRPAGGWGWGATDDGDFDSLLRAVERLALNDAALEWEREQSPALGMGLRMGFLGVLHMEVKIMMLMCCAARPVNGPGGGGWGGTCTHDIACHSH